jgi:PHP family Zn ribbon phosphoesterase
LTKEFSSEVAVLIDADIEDIAKVPAPAITEEIEEFREGKVIIHPGGGGRYGVIELPSSTKKVNSSIYISEQKSLLDYR